ncbi:MAG: bifunctional glycosyltransferase family 2/GtrA family protein [Eubacterium sp.]|nr:bifunctional glycosyltransferase family 2/GtrA family protein [Eubacterium sp.]
MKQIITLIPAYEPDDKLITLIRQLMHSGRKEIVVVDDGSSADKAGIFDQAEEAGCLVVHHASNRGKGAALRTGIEAAIDEYGSDIGIITADADGQHTPEDIGRLAEEMRRNDRALIIGARDFSGPDVPRHNRIGNRITAFLFRLMTGVDCRDTQTGLRGIPPSLLPLALSTKGDRYEYEMDFLTAAARQAAFVSVPIRTVYLEGNKSSHFRVVRDSVRIYGRLFKYLLSSLTGAAVDVSAYYLLLQILPLRQSTAIYMATILTRLLSGGVNFTMNKYFSFGSKGNTGVEAFRYGLLFASQMFASGILTNLLVSLTMAELPAKIVTDVFLFFISYLIQRRWVFAEQYEEVEE